MLKQVVVLLGGCLIAGLSGCVSLPSEPVTLVIDPNELANHVQFLAQPRLKGRKPLSLGSRTARQYIAERFKACGLVPWGQSSAYTQSFAIGTNMIGMLPGSDPNCADEFVLVSAHYDHFGKTKYGMCLGACDNASGVAALLEMAESLALSPNPPKRSICFAAYDREEDGLLGAFAFSCRPDFDRSKLAGVVNMDMLGRAGFEVLDRHLFVVGTERCRSIRNTIRAAAQDKLIILPMGSDLAGARGDHVPFEDMNVPCLMFSCGMIRDYHQSTDTPDKIDYAVLRDSSKVIQDTVRILADGPRMRTQAYVNGDRDELEALERCLNLIIDGYEKVELTTEDANGLVVLRDRLKGHLAAGQTGPKIKRELIFDHFEQFSRLLTWPMYLLDPNEEDDEIFYDRVGAWSLCLMNLDFRPNMIEAGRGALRHLQQHRAKLLWGMPDFEYKVAVLHPDYVYLAPQKNQEQHLLTYIPFSMKFNVWPPGLFKWRFGKQLYGMNCNWARRAKFGSLGELVDIQLLNWHKDTKGIWDDVRNQLLCLLSHETSLKSKAQWFQYRLNQGGWSDETQWVLDRIECANEQVSAAAIGHASQQESEPFTVALSSVLTDPNRSGHVRWKVMSSSTLR